MMSRSSLSMPDLSLWKRGVIVLVSALAHGLVLAATLIWSQRELPVPAQSSPLVELEFDAPAPIPDAPVAAPRPMPAPMPEPVPNVTPEPRSLQAPPPPDETKNELRDAPPKAMEPPPKVTRPMPKPTPVRPPPAPPRPATSLSRLVAAPVTAPTPAVSAPVASPPQAVAPAPPVSPDWRRSLGAWIGANRVYPEDARRNGAQGTVAVQLTVDRLGHVVSVELARSSGSALLDETTLAMLKNGSLPPFSPDMTQDRLTITVQVHYALAN